MTEQSAEKAAIPGLGDQVQMRFSCPNYDKGQVGTLTRFQGSKVGALWWVEFGVERYGSTGCWAGRGEFERVFPPGQTAD